MLTFIYFLFYFWLERKLSSFTCKSDLERITDSYNFPLIGELLDSNVCWLLLHNFLVIIQHTKHVLQSYFMKIKFSTYLKLIG